MKTITFEEFDKMRDKVTGYYKLCPNCPTSFHIIAYTQVHFAVMPSIKEPFRTSWECRGESPFNIPSMEYLTLDFCREMTGHKKTDQFTVFGKDGNSMLVISEEGQKTITTEDCFK